jgi:hypothetical protein
MTSKHDLRGVPSKKETRPEHLPKMSGKPIIKSGRKKKG